MKIGIIGLGCVGLPLVIQFSKSGTQVLGIDVDVTKFNALDAGESYIKHISAAEVRAQRAAEQIEATTDCARAKELDAALTATAHTSVNHIQLTQWIPCVVDTRNALLATINSVRA